MSGAAGTPYPASRGTEDTEQARRQPRVTCKVLEITFHLSPFVVLCHLQPHDDGGAPGGGLRLSGFVVLGRS